MTMKVIYDKTSIFHHTAFNTNDFLCIKRS